jgi:rod shape-determining protein MreC
MFTFWKNARLSAVLLVVALLLVFLHWVGVLRPVEDLVIRVISPIQQRVYALGVNINGLYANITGKNELVQEREALQQEIQDLLVENASLKTRLESLSELLEQQDFLNRNSLEYVAARVIGQNPEATLQAIILDKGSAHGVGVDYPVVIGNGMLVGKISSVRTYSSEAILINDSQSKISAIIQNENQTQGVVVGEYDHGADSAK